MPELRGRTPWVAYWMIAANVVVFGLALARGVSAFSPTTVELFDLGASYAPRTLDGEPWRLATSMFLHAGLLHIALNMIGLVQARHVELIYGHVGFAAIYLVSGLAGAVATLVVSPEATVVGASGAVFGVFGSFGAYLVLRKAAMPEEAWRNATRQMIMFLAINLVFGLSTSGISMAAHVGGLAAGFAIGAGLLVRTPRDARHPLRAAGLLAAGLAATAAAVLTLPAPSDVPAALEEFGRLEATAIRNEADLTARAKTGGLDDAALADAMERDVLAPWKTAAQRMAGLTRPPPRWRGLVEALATYTAARRTASESRIALLRATPADRARLEALVDEHERAVVTAFEAVEARARAQR